MTVADILYFASLASAAFISTAVLLRQYFRGDLAEHDAGVRRLDAASAPRATHRVTAAGTHHRRAA